MHELHAADKILNKVIDFGTRKQLERIVAVYIDLGVVIEHGEEINPKVLRDNFANLAHNTIAKDAKLHIKKVRGDSIKITEIDGE